MKRIKLPFQFGMYGEIAKKAKALAKEKNCLVEFEFNGTNNVVNSETNLDLLWRDMQNSYTTGWKEVGPNCIDEYSDEIKAELAEKERLNEVKQLERIIKLENKDKAQREEFEILTKGIDFEFSNKDLWETGIANNKDGYGGAIYEYAKSWGLLMQARIDKGEALKDIAEETSFQLVFYGITGFMYGAAVSVLSSTWKYGEELRKWHNKEYKHEGDGVVNPALLTIKTD